MKNKWTNIYRFWIDMTVCSNMKVTFTIMQFYIMA